MAQNHVDAEFNQDINKAWEALKFTTWSFNGLKAPNKKTPSIAPDVFINNLIISYGNSAPPPSDVMTNWEENKRRYQWLLDNFYNKIDVYVDEHWVDVPCPPLPPRGSICFSYYPTSSAKQFMKVLLSSSLRPLDKEVRKAWLFHIDSGPSNWFESFRENVLVPSASIAADVGAAATVAASIYVVGSAIASYYGSTVAATEGGSALAASGTPAVVTTSTSTVAAGTSSLIPSGVTSAITAGGAKLLETAGGALIAKELNQIINPKPPPIQAPVKNTQQIVANGEAPKKNIGGYVIAGAAAIFLLGAI